MKMKISILYSWLVRTITILLPNIPVFMRFRGFLYSLMMKQCGKNFQVTSSAILNPLAGIAVGDHVYIAHNTVVLGVAVEIGNEVLIGPNCIISANNHSYLGTSYRFGKAVVKPVKIGNGSWVAGNCSVLAGSALPARSILAAGAVLSKKYEEEGSIYGGVPAVFLKKGTI